MSESSSRPLLTFAVGAYCQERFVREAVEGAFAQTYSPLQIILSDDCSKDRTFEIMREMAAAYRGPHRVVLNRNPVNFGLARHVNRLIELSEGAFFVVSAGDDVSLPDRTEMVYRAWEHSGRKAMAIQTGHIDIDENGAPPGGSGEPQRARTVEFVEQKPTLESYVRTLQPSILGGAFAYDPKVFSTFGPLPEKLIHEDNVVALRSLLLGSLVFVTAPLIKRRIHGNNLFSRVHDVVATREGVVKQEARTIRDAHNRVVLYETFLADLKLAKDNGMLSGAQWLVLQKECLRCQRLFSYSVEHPGATLLRKLQLLWAARREQADSQQMKWMLLRLLPASLFNSLKAAGNSVRTALKSKFSPEPGKRWTS